MADRRFVPKFRVADLGSAVSFGRGKSKGQPLVALDEQSLKALQEELKKIPAKLREKVLRKAVKKGGEVFLGQAQMMVPVRSGLGKGSLTLSTVKALKGRPESVSVLVGAKTKFGATLKGKKGPDTYLRWVEFGTHGNPGTPFMRAAFDTGKGAAMEVATAEVRRALAREKL